MFEKDMPHGDWYIMYKNVTEGTPISPVCETKILLESWLTDNDATLFGDTHASFFHWLSIIEQGFYFPILRR